jgi:hypothetical protein
VLTRIVDTTTASAIPPFTQPVSYYLVGSRCGTTLSTAGHDSIGRSIDP